MAKKTTHLTASQTTAIKTAVRAAKKMCGRDNIVAVDGLEGVSIRVTLHRGRQYPVWHLNFSVDGKKFTQGKLRLEWVLNYAPTTTMSRLVSWIDELLPLTTRWVDA